MSESVDDLEDFLQEELFSGKPKSVGEAVADQEPSAPPEDAAEVVLDEPPSRQEPTPEVPPEEPEQPELEPGEEGEPPEDEGVAWAKRKYGDDPTKWARAAHEQERHISQLAREKRESDELASQWYQYSQQVESQAQQQLGSAMPLSAQEEQWIENSISNPLEFARQAAHNGRVHLYQGVINRVAEESPGLAAQIGAQVQVEMQQIVQAQQQQQPQVTLEDSLGASFNRVGLDLEKEGPGMAAKVAELGNHHPYVRAIMGGDDGQRDLAVQAVHDLVRATNFTPRQVERNANLQRENELRRDTASVQTGGVSPPAPPPSDSTFVQEMQAEWERAGQWQAEE